MSDWRKTAQAIQALSKKKKPKARQGTGLKDQLDALLAALKEKQ